MVCLDPNEPIPFVRTYVVREFIVRSPKQGRFYRGFMVWAYT